MRHLAMVVPRPTVVPADQAFGLKPGTFDRFLDVADVSAEKTLPLSDHGSTRREILLEASASVDPGLTLRRNL